MFGAIHSTKIHTGPTGKRGPPQKVDLFFRNFSGWTEPIHWVLDQNFRKFWLNGSRPLSEGSHSELGLPVLHRDLRAEQIFESICWTYWWDLLCPCWSETSFLAWFKWIESLILAYYFELIFKAWRGLVHGNALKKRKPIAFCDDLNKDRSLCNSLNKEYKV